jgi:DNA-binding FrmR family transcriptional regulator
MEKINLLRAQIAAFKEHLNECIDETMKQKYEKDLAELGNKLDELLLSQFMY